MAALGEGEIEIFFFRVADASGVNGIEQHPSGVRIIEGVYQVPFTTTVIEASEAG